MSQLELKSNHKLVQSYYAALAQLEQHCASHATAVRQTFLSHE